MSTKLLKSAKMISSNFDKIPEDVRNQLLFKISNLTRGNWYIAKLLRDNFDKIPEDVRNRLIVKISSSNRKYNPP